MGAIEPEAKVACYGLVHLFYAVNKRLCDDRVEVDQFFGWREPTKQKARRRRIVWVPGGQDGSLGDVSSAKQPGRNPRSLATIYELFTVHVSARDISAAEDEQAQYEVTRLLFDQWYRACYLAATGIFMVRRAGWNLAQMERRAGAEIVAECTIESMIPDKAVPLADLDQVATTVAVDAYSEATVIAP